MTITFSKKMHIKICYVGHRGINSVFKIYIRLVADPECSITGEIHVIDNHKVIVFTDDQLKNLGIFGKSLKEELNKCISVEELKNLSLSTLRKRK